MTVTAPLLVSTGWLESHIGTPGLRVLDTTTYLSPQPVGASIRTPGLADYRARHIPGAHYVDLDEDLSDPAGQFPYTILSPSAFEQLMSRLSITNDTHVVFYGNKQPMVTTRAWFVVLAMGHARLSVLDGGFDKWVREGRPIACGDEPLPAPSQYTAHYDPNRIKAADDVAAALASGSTAVVNGLSAEQHRGTSGPHYGRPGRIPGSVSVPWSELFDPQEGTWLPREELKKVLGKAGLTDNERSVINYCGGAIAATATAFAETLVGFKDVSVYDNSLLEWATDLKRPMEVDGEHEGS